MPTNQSVSWTSGKLRDNNKGFMRPTMGKVPSRPRHETTQTRDSAKPLSPLTQSASYCRGGGNVDGKTQAKFTHTPHPPNTVPFQDRPAHHLAVAQNQIWKLQDPCQCESLVAAEMEGADHPQRRGCCPVGHGTPPNTPAERIRKFNSELEFTKTVRKLTQSRSALTPHPRNKTVNGVTTGPSGSNMDPVKMDKAVTTSSVSVIHSLAPAKPSVPLCLTKRDQETEPSVPPVSMETSSASSLDSNTTTTNSRSTAASMAPLPHAGITPTQSPTQASATVSSGAGITPTQSPTQASATVSSGAGITPTQSPTQASATVSSGAGITPTQSPTQASATVSSGAGITPTQSPTQASATVSSGAGITPTQSPNQASATVSSGAGITLTQSPTQASATVSSGAGITLTQSPTQASATVSSGAGITLTQSPTQASATVSSGAGITPTQSPTQASATVSSCASITPTQSPTQASATVSSGAGITPTQSPTQASATVSSGAGITPTQSPTQSPTQASATVSSGAGITPTQSPTQASATVSSGASSIPENTEVGSESCSGSTQSWRPSVTSVTTQISALHLTKERSVLSLQGGHSNSPSQSLPALEEEQQATESPQLPSPESVAMQEDGDAREEEFPDDELDDCSGGGDDDDDGSDCSSINDASSTASMPVHVADEEQMSPELEEEVKPALIPSMFPLIPPTLYFSTANQRVESLPPEQRKLLKWKMSTVTPTVVKHTIARSHFKVTQNSHDWLGCWGHHMKSPGFKAIREYQKLNHFPGSFQIGRKDRLWRNLSKMQAQFGKREFSFFPRSFVLPQDVKLLKKAWEDSGSRQKWIIKPPASARGIGIQVIHKWSQMPRKRPLLVQKSDPYVNTLVKMHLRSSYSCHELFGFDVMLDENLKPWVLEVNISPSLHSSTSLDVTIKGQMIRDVLNLAGFLLPQREEVHPSFSSSGSSSSSLSGGTRERTRSDISTDEKVKRAFYLSQRFADQDFFSSILDVMTPEDVRVLAETEDELIRKGEFERVFPSHCSSRYLRFFKQTRYLNILLNQWETKYGQNRREGVSVLRAFCQKGVHLGRKDSAHIWSTYVPQFDSPTRQEPIRSSVVASCRTRRTRMSSSPSQTPASCPPPPPTAPLHP
ncbi:tubulin monoglutamylase TTLL4 isoform X2 [Salvelinus alpinus]|uniref:tubulin monoglutamylase TTLL4 isoform X2 n=1 Tax=Salvelinus alpinus TaxID=8036 RepID=UPI0039FBC179